MIESQASLAPKMDREYEATRAQKASKTLAILEDALGPRLGELRALEIGCHAGEVSRNLAPRFREYVAIDLDTALVEAARSKPGTPANLSFLAADGTRTGFPDASFDVVLCSHVYEHVSDPHALLAEIHRLLERGGACYFAAANRLTVMEPHYRLPFLSWLPICLANRYLRGTRGVAEYDVRLRTLPVLRRLVSAFELRDYTLRVVREPERFAAIDLFRPGSAGHRAARLLLPLLYWACPTYLWVLIKSR